MDIVTIDFETYYSRTYSLSKMTTEEYIEGSEFQVIGVGVKVNTHPTDWYSGKDVGGFLKSIDYSDKAILCHNTVFDGAILSWKYGIKPRFWMDTMSMARPYHAATTGVSLKALANHYGIGEKGTAVQDFIGVRREGFTPTMMKYYAEYCMQDVELTYKLFAELSKDFPVSELQVIDQTIRMYTDPRLVLNRFTLQDHLDDVLAKKQALLDKLGGAERAKKILMSNPRFAALLATLGAEIPMKKSPTTGEQTFAFAKTDAGMKELLAHENPQISTAAEVRLGIKSTIEETRTARLIEVSKRGPLPVMLNYYGAHTGRYSGGDKLNIQNLPARGGNNAIRRSIEAPEGHKLVVSDSAQIEGRVLPWLAKQEDLLEAFREGRDVYSEFAAKVYQYPVDKSLAKERFVGKTCILGLGYGMGHVRFGDTMNLGTMGMVVKMDEAEARNIVQLYRTENHKIATLWQLGNVFLSDTVAGRSGTVGGLPYDSDGIQLPNGMKLRYNKLVAVGSQYEYTHRKQFKKIYGAKVIENITQALARIIVVEQMAKIGEHWPVVFQVHDENVAVVPDAEVPEAVELVNQIMSTPPTWAPDLPVACETGVGVNYGEAK